MASFSNFILSIVQMVLGLAVSAAIFFERGARAALNIFGLPVHIQNITLIGGAICLAIFLNRALGSVIGSIIALFLGLMIAHVLWPEVISQFSTLHG